MEKGNIKLCWEKDAEASGYIIEQYLDETVKELVRIENVDITCVIIPNISPGEENHFRIQYFEKGMNSEQRIYKEIHRYCFWNRTRTVIYELPTPMLISAKITNVGIEIRWKAIPEDVLYVVMRRINDGKWARIGMTKNSYYLDENVELSRKCIYSVRCASEDGKELLSSFCTKGVCVPNEQ